jgi:hypothetical protein
LVAGDLGSYDQLAGLVRLDIGFYGAQGSHREWACGHDNSSFYLIKRDPQAFPFALCGFRVSTSILSQSPTQFFSVRGQVDITIADIAAE